MFHSFMNKVHGLPLTNDPSQEWWTSEEAELLKKLNEATEYVYDGSGRKPRFDLHPHEFVWEGGIVQPYLSVELLQFLQEDLGLGRYQGAVSVSSCFIEWKESPKEDPEGRVEFGEEFFTGEDEDDEGEFLVPVFINGVQIGLAYFYDECDCEVVYVFEKGSIAYAHYGRGAGVSLRLHKNLSKDGDPTNGDPLGYFESFSYIEE